MPDLYLKNCDITTPEGLIERGSLSVRSGLIEGFAGVSSGDTDEVDLEGCLLLPGFIDIHCHGAVGVDVNESDGEGLSRVGAFLASNGVTGWLPTLVPDSEEAYVRTVAAIEDASGVPGGRARSARVLGIHYEGVFANHHKCGALRPEYFRTYSPGVPVNLPVPVQGAKMATVAPEIGNGIELVRELVSNGWIAAAGHTEAGVDTLEAAHEVGLRHLTHFFNAMSGIHHRSLGTAGWGLVRDGVSFDIIADGHHVHPDLLKAVVTARSSENVILISDSISAAGLGDGEYEVWGKKIVVAGRSATDSDLTISGSVISMLDAFNLVLSKGFAPEEASRMASLNPARLLGIDLQTGSIEKGKAADLVAVRDGEAVLTVIGGEIVHDAL